MRSCYFLLRSKLQKDYIFKIKLFKSWFYCPANNFKLGVNGYLYSHREKYEISLGHYFTLKPESYFWDIGANIGFYNVFQLSQKNIFVRSVEPDKENFSILKKNLNQWKKNKVGNIKTFNLGLGYKEEKLSILSTNNDSGSLFLSNKLDSSKNQVKVTTLDKLIQLTGDKKVDFLRLMLRAWNIILVELRKRLRSINPK